MSPSLAPNISNKTPGSLQLHNFLQMLQQPFQLLLPKPTKTTDPQLFSVIEIQVPPSEPSNFTWKAFFSTSKNFAIPSQHYIILFFIDIAFIHNHMPCSFKLV